MLPTTFSTVISRCPRRAAGIEAATSGIDVPVATMGIPSAGRHLSMEPRDVLKLPPLMVEWACGGRGSNFQHRPDRPLRFRGAALGQP